jgi:polyprenyl P-hydroxybenzoate/phenylacrylic acid decarboxylase-like protein
MAPVTNIGSATPIAIGPNGESQDLSRKIKNDAAAGMRALASAHGRNARLASLLVTQARNLTAKEALNDNLIVRAADVHLKERRKLVLMVRETPLNATHLRLMHELTLAGAVILPPVPGFYQKPKTLMDLVDHSVGKALDQLGIEHQLFRRWTGPDR